MKKDIAMAWVAELRNPALVQGRGALRTADNKFCCLGVLCNVHAKSHLAIAKSETSKTSYLGQEMVLPTQVRYWAKMRTPNGGRLFGIFIGNMGYGGLADANDSGVPFSAIADWIEKNYECL